MNCFGCVAFENLLENQFTNGAVPPFPLPSSGSVVVRKRLCDLFCFVSAFSTMHLDLLNSVFGFINYITF